MSRAQGNEGRSALCSHKSGSAFVPLHRAKPVRPSEQRPEGLCSEGLAARRTPPRAQAARPPARLRKPGPIPRAQAVRPPARLRKPGPIPRAQAVRPPARLRKPGPIPRAQAVRPPARSHKPGPFREPRPPGRRRAYASQAFSPPPGTGLLLTPNMPRTTRNSGGDSIYERLHENL